MARAKRTQRADARRRHRAQAAELEGVAAETPGARPAPGPTRAAAAAPPERPSILYALRTAFRRPDYATDLRLLPQLVTTRSVWLPAAISVGTTALLFATGGRDIVSALLAQYFILTPPVGAIFLSGFLAPRASYLTGAISGLVGALCLTVILASGFGTGGTTGLVPVATASPSASAAAAASASESAAPSAPASASAAPSASTAPSASAAESPSPSATPAPGAIATSTPGDAISAALVISPLTGALFGAAAAWYRRFLNLANPNRGRQPPPKRRPNQRRR